MNQRHAKGDAEELPPHPGEILFRRCLVPFHISGRRLANHIGIALPRLEGLCARRTGVTAALAWLLGYAFGTTHATWLLMQLHYDLAVFGREHPAQRTEWQTSPNAPPLLPADPPWRAAVSRHLRQKFRTTLPFGLPRVPVSPGEILTGVFLSAAGEQPRPFAKKPGLHHSRIQRVISGSRKIRANMAWLLAAEFSTPPTLWMNLQGIYDLVGAYPAVEPVALLEKAFLPEVPQEREACDGIPESVLCAQGTQELFEQMRD